MQLASGLIFLTKIPGKLYLRERVTLTHYSTVLLIYTPRKHKHKHEHVTFKKNATAPKYISNLTKGYCICLILPGSTNLKFIETVLHG